MKFEVHFPVFMAKFERPVDWMYGFGKRHSRFFRRLGDFSALVGIIGMVVAFAFLVRGAVTIVGGGPAQVGLVVPGLRIPGSPVYIPLFEGLIAVLLLAVFHEGMHGIMAAAEGIKSKYTALILFLFIPAAGVEIDEKRLEKKKPLSRIRIFSAGSMGNFILALLCLGLLFPMSALLANFVEPEGLEVVNSSNLALAPGDLILEINGHDVRSVALLQEVLGGIGPGGSVEVRTQNGTVFGHLTSEGKLGVYLQSRISYTGVLGHVLGFIGRVLGISFQLNLGVGLINLLPLGILDGGRIMAELSRKYYRLASIAAAALLVLNLIGPYVF
jgi:membrane-associated protease RseP (regulator of RpoE activity)